jgi:hypothetical protein
MCSAHHRAVHDGFLIIQGNAEAATFRHADGTAYGGDVSPVRAQVFSDAFKSLTDSGYGQGDARRALEHVRAHVGTDASLEVVLKEAFAAMRLVRRS